ncbi:hypothetical protein Ddc_14489 [Ditylenchus destructor]|nr:hypothetical protein Ddc_14489 [Ditylenchus destructor]
MAKHFILALAFILLIYFTYIDTHFVAIREHGSRFPTLCYSIGELAFQVCRIDIQTASAIGIYNNQTMHWFYQNFGYFYYDTTRRLPTFVNPVLVHLAAQANVQPVIFQPGQMYFGGYNVRGGLPSDCYVIVESTIPPQGTGQVAVTHSRFRKISRINPLDLTKAQPAAPSQLVAGVALPPPSEIQNDNGAGMQPPPARSRPSKSHRSRGTTSQGSPENGRSVGGGMYNPSDFVMGQDDYNAFMAKYVNTRDRY